MAKPTRDLGWTIGGIILYLVTLVYASIDLIQRNFEGGWNNAFNILVISLVSYGLGFHIRDLLRSLPSKQS